MSQIAKLSGVDLIDRKISNHSGRKMLIQGLQRLGVSKEEIALQSRHKSLEGINAYTLHPEQQHYDILNEFANKFQSASQGLFNLNTYIFFLFN
jgi:integrase